MVGTNSKHWGPTKDLARVTTVGGVIKLLRPVANVFTQLQVRD